MGAVVVSPVDTLARNLGDARESFFLMESLVVWVLAVRRKRGYGIFDVRRIERVNAM
jgi:hypothetical protein